MFWPSVATLNERVCFQSQRWMVDTLFITVFFFFFEAVFDETENKIRRKYIGYTEAPISGTGCDKFPKGLYF